MAVKFLDNTGLGYFWSKIKAWCNSTFAAIAHTHTSYAVKHSYTTAANAAKNWYRIANANTSQLDTTKPIHAQFILTAYNASYDAGYYERWFVNAEVFGRTAHIAIFGNTTAPFNQARILYENTTADLDANDRPAIDIYLNYQLANGTTKIEIEEVYNSGWTFVNNGQISASSVPTGFESQACSIRGNGVERSSYCDWASYTSLQRSNFTANFTLADNNTYRARVLNCTGTITVTVPSINSANSWFIIKNFNTSSGNITIHPSTTSVLIDGSNDDIILRPTEYIMIHSKAANAYTIVFDGRRRLAMVGRSGTVGSNPKHWFLVAETTNAGTSQDIYISFKVFVGSGTTQCGGILNAHARVDATKGVVSNMQLQWEYKTQGIALEDFAITNIDTSGTSTKLQIWCKLTGAYSHYKFAVIAEQPYGDATDVHTWNLTRARKTDGDIASLNTGFTNVVTSTLLTIANSITGNAATASAVTWSGVTSKPSTISGYGITDAKIANGTITLGSNTITPLTSHQTLPTLSRTISGSGNAITDITVSNHAITATKGSTFALDSDAVHKNANETINGIKVIENGATYTNVSTEFPTQNKSELVIKNSLVTKGVTPSNLTFTRVSFVDSTNTGGPATFSDRLGCIECANRLDGSSEIQIVADKPDGTEQSVAVRIGYLADGVTTFCRIPSTRNDPVYNEAITYDWIPKDTRLVHTTGDETVQGIKEFSNDYHDTTAQGDYSHSHSIVLRSTEIAKGMDFTTLSGNDYTSLIFQDNSGNLINWNGRLGFVSFSAMTDGSYNVNLTCCKNVNNIESTYLSVGYDSNGIAYAVAPSTSSSRSEGNDLVTRNWIPQDTRIVHTTGDETIAGNKTLTNNLTVSKNIPLLQIKSSGTSNSYRDVRFLDKDDTVVAAFRSSAGESLTIGTKASSGGWTDGPQLELNHSGVFTLKSSNGTTLKSLVGSYDGTLTWDSNDITGDVHKSGAETIDGIKTFKQYVRCDNSSEQRGISGTSSTTSFLVGAANSINSGAYVQLYGKDSSSNAGAFVVTASIGSGTTNKKTLQGTSSGTLSWDGQTIQTSSDERLKTPLSAVPDRVLDAWGDVNWGQFQFLEAVQEKGEYARLHLGLIAQKVKAVFETHGLDACVYGILCHEEREATEEEPAVDLWMVRYEEALAMEAAFQRRRAEKAEARIKALEDRLEALEAKLS